MKPSPTTVKEAIRAFFADNLVKKEGTFHIGNAKIVYSKLKGVEGWYISFVVRNRMPSVEFHDSNEFLENEYSASYARALVWSEFQPIIPVVKKKYEGRRMNLTVRASTPSRLQRAIDGLNLMDPTELKVHEIVSSISEYMKKVSKPYVRWEYSIDAQFHGVRVQQRKPAPTRKKR